MWMKQYRMTSSVKCSCRSSRHSAEMWQSSSSSFFNRGKCTSGLNDPSYSLRLTCSKWLHAETRDTSDRVEQSPAFSSERLVRCEHRATHFWIMCESMGILPRRANLLNECLFLRMIVVRSDIDSFWCCMSGMVRSKVSKPPLMLLIIKANHLRWHSFRHGPITISRTVDQNETGNWSMQFSRVAQSDRKTKRSTARNFFRWSKQCNKLFNCCISWSCSSVVSLYDKVTPSTFPPLPFLLLLLFSPFFFFFLWSPLSKLLFSFLCFVDFDDDDNSDRWWRMGSNDTSFSISNTENRDSKYKSTALDQCVFTEVHE